MDGVADGIDTGSPVAGTILKAGNDTRQREAAFGAIVDRHATLMYRVAFSLLRNAQDAEDAVQETLLKLYRGEAWRAMDDEKAFLARSVWRVGLNRLGTRPAKAMRNASDVSELQIASSDLTPEESAVECGERDLVRRLIDDLPEGFRQALILSAIEGLRSQEVAELLGIHEGTVRTRVLRARGELRKRYLEFTRLGKAVMKGRPAMNEFELEQTMLEVIAGAANVEAPDGLARRLTVNTFEESRRDGNLLTFGTLDRMTGSGQTRKTAIGALALHAAVLLLACFEMRALQGRMAAPVQVESEISLTAPPPLQPPVSQAADGGGGHAGAAPVARGNPPKDADRQLVPLEQPPVVQPKLSVEATIVMQPDMKMAQTLLPQFGMPNSPAIGSSLGNGQGPGLGAGYGAGVGPGNGGNLGNNLRRIGGGVRAPEVLFAPTPEFSEEARKAKLSGNVLVSLQVDERGRPTHIRISRGLGMGLDEKALEAVRQYRFKPAMEDGRPVAVEMNVTSSSRFSNPEEIVESLTWTGGKPLNRSPNARPSLAGEAPIR